MRPFKLAMKESSDLVDLTEEAEEERVKDGRGLLLVGCEAKYDAGLKDRLAMALDSTVTALPCFS